MVAMGHLTLCNATRRLSTSKALVALTSSTYDLGLLQFKCRSCKTWQLRFLKSDHHTSADNQLLPGPMIVRTALRRVVFPTQIGCTPSCLSREQRHLDQHEEQILWATDPKHIDPWMPSCGKCRDISINSCASRLDGPAAPDYLMRRHG